MIYLTLATLALLPHVMALVWYLAERSEKRRGNQIYGLEYASGQLRRELKNSLWMPLHAVVAGIFYYAGAFDGTSIASFFGSFLLTYVWAEVFHYYSHRLFHHKKFLWIHEEHHKSMVNSPFTALSFGLYEKIIFSVGIFAIPAIVNFFVAVNFYGNCTWYVAYLFINSFSHANYEAKADQYINKLGRWITSTTFHSLHHSRYVKNYGLGTRFLDRLHDTEWRDYEPVYSSIKADKPLKKLNERR